MFVKECGESETHFPIPKSKCSHLNVSATLISFLQEIWNTKLVFALCLNKANRDGCNGFVSTSVILIFLLEVGMNLIIHWWRHTYITITSLSSTSEKKTHFSNSYCTRFLLICSMKYDNSHWWSRSLHQKINMKTNRIL